MVPVSFRLYSELQVVSYGYVEATHHLVILFSACWRHMRHVNMQKEEDLSSWLEQTSFWCRFSFYICAVSVLFYTHIRYVVDMPLSMNNKSVHLLPSPILHVYTAKILPARFLWVMIQVCFHSKKRLKYFFLCIKCYKTQMYTITQTPECYFKVILSYRVYSCIC